CGVSPCESRELPGFISSEYPQRKLGVFAFLGMILFTDLFIYSSFSSDEYSALATGSPSVC
ncbi:hypothetical protein, partial [Photorhabdus temperata]|uniref:hypothetical protein n=1 Tax=Photorhabdus temperata TaxID=574560 RepID=UPI001F35B071